jgi:hypothetical protein
MLQGLCFGLLYVALQMCQMIASSPDKNRDQKREVEVFSFLFFINYFYLVKLLVKSSRSGYKVGLCLYISIITLHFY